MKFNHIALTMTLLALSGCVTPTPYKAADADHRNGYSDQRLADNRIRVSFSGNSATRREQVEDYLLLRSAETTREAGFAWFAFDTRDTDWAFDPLGNVETTIPATRYEAYAEILLLTPEQARADAHALRAGDVIARLGPMAVRSTEH